MTQRTSLFIRVARLIAALAAGWAAYWFGLRPWHLTWGATRAEVDAFLPGDDLVPNPAIDATHAITVQAPPHLVWPWLVQIGQGRGGFYSYDWIENAMGLDIHSAHRILAEYQDLQPGDLIPLAPDGFGVPVAVVEPPRTLVLHGDSRQPGLDGGPPVKPGEYVALTWSFHLFEQVDGSTRLVERWRADWTPTLANNLFYRLFLEPGAFLMERKMLLGIKQRAESVGADGIRPEDMR